MSGSDESEETLVQQPVRSEMHLQFTKRLEREAVGTLRNFVTLHRDEVLADPVMTLAYGRMCDEAASNTERMLAYLALMHRLLWLKAGTEERKHMVHTMALFFDDAPLTEAPQRRRMLNL